MEPFVDQVRDRERHPDRLVPRLAPPVHARERSPTDAVRGDALRTLRLSCGPVLLADANAGARHTSTRA